MMTLKIGDVKRIKMGQNYTCKSACGCVCVIDRLAYDEYHVRVQLKDGAHIGQYVRPEHVEEL